MHSLGPAAVLAVLSSAAEAATLDFSGLGPGHVPESAALVGGATLGSGGDGGVAGDGFFVAETGAAAAICAWSLRAPYEGCTHDLGIDFDGPVSGLSFEVSGVDWGDHAAVYVFGAGDEHLDTIDVGWEFGGEGTTGYRVDLSSLGPIESLWFDHYNGTESRGVRGLSYGRFAFDAAPAARRMAAVVAPVPLPASLALTLGGLGALGLLRRRTA